MWTASNSRYSLSQCRQSYTHMDIALKNDLPRKLDSIAPEYGLVELQYPSFVRAFGFQLAALSAADAVEGLEALLEAATGIRMEIEIDGGRGGGEWFGGTRTWSLGCENGGSNGATPEPEEEDPAEKDIRKDRQWYIRNFWEAYDACEK